MYINDHNSSQRWRPRVLYIGTGLHNPYHLGIFYRKRICFWRWRERLVWIDHRVEHHAGHYCAIRQLAHLHHTKLSAQPRVEVLCNAWLSTVQSFEYAWKCTVYCSTTLKWHVISAVYLFLAREGHTWLTTGRNLMATRLNIIKFYCVRSFSYKIHAVQFKHRQKKT